MVTSSMVNAIDGNAIDGKRYRRYTRTMIAQSVVYFIDGGGEHTIDGIRKRW